MRKARIATCLANILDHFDTSLYGFLVPILAPLFFPKSDPVVALIQGYGIVIIGFITRPLGALYFSKQADAIGPHRVLTTTIMGMTATTFCFTVLQPYEYWGASAAAILCMLRGMQNFFGAGETSIAGLYLLEDIKPEKQHPMTSMYLGTQMGGILLAGAVANVIFQTSQPELYWKWPFYGSLVTGLAGWWLRRQQTLVYVPKQKHLNTSINWKGILRLIPITGLSYVLYSAPLVFFTGFASVATSIPVKDLMASNTALLIFDLILLAILGPIIRRVDSKKLLLAISASTVIMVPILFWYIPYVGLLGACVIRSIIIILGVGFCIPLHRWYMEEFEVSSRYTTTAIGYAVGSETLGRSFPAVGLALWHITHLAIVPGIYIALVSLFAYLSIALPKAWKIRYKWNQRFLLSSLRKKGFSG